MLRIAFDATPLLGRRTGIGVAVARSLAGLAGRRQLDVIGYGLTGRGRRQLPALLPPGVRPAPVTVPAAAALRWWERFDKPPIEWLTGPVEVAHGTNFVVPPTTGAARVVTVYDLTAVSHPELCAPASLRYPALIRRAVRTGAVVHVPTVTVGREAQEAYEIPADRLRVIPFGVDQPAMERLAADRGPGTASGGSARPYVLFLGTVEPRKDLPALVGAFDQVADAHPDVELRIAGPDGWGEGELTAAIQHSRHAARIHRLGWVDDPARLLAGALLLVLPSRYEGFGFPPLEAMAAGVPVLATRAGSLPEVLGDAACLVPVGERGALAQALDALLGDPAARERLVAAGYRQVAGFRWEATVDGLVALYQELAA